ncbi:MAG: redoxin domain-containing protein [Thiomicrorhabdus sp.]|jgi:thiol-disulfide isomerase/thioredoxin|nr:redoxin domain-containing protein [Thiomicrorhabdus sp.]
MTSKQTDTPEKKSEVSPKTQSFWKKNWVKNTLTGLFFVGVFLLLRPYMQGDVVEGQAPIMQVQSITGKAIDLQALNQQGKPVLIHIWATWCPICDISKGGIESVAKDYAVINIASMSADDDQLLTFAQENEMNPDIIVNDLEGKWQKAFGAKAVPADFVIAPNGEIAFVEVGFTTSMGLRLRLWWATLMTD